MCKFDMDKDLETVKISEKERKFIDKFNREHHQRTDHLSIDFLIGISCECCATCLYCDKHAYTNTIFNVDKCHCEATDKWAYADNICDGYVRRLL